MLTVIGCGNPACGDDGAGVEVARRLRRLLPPAAPVRVLEAATDGFAVLAHLDGGGRVVIVDACRGGAPAGTIRRLSATALDAPPPVGLSPHALRWDHALALAMALRGPAVAERVAVALIEGAHFAPGQAMSRAVDRACTRLARELAREPALPPRAGVPPSPGRRSG